MPRKKKTTETVVEQDDVDQETDVVAGIIQGLVQLRTNVGAVNDNVTSLLAAVQTGKFGTNVTGQYTREDINGTEAMQHSAALLPLYGMQTYGTLALQMLQANNVAIMNIAGLSEISLEKARDHGHKADRKGK